MKPREIVVISGKGGTGKTTFTSLLTASFGKAVICDADVDAPDLEILLKPEPIAEQPFWGMQTAKVNPDLCTGCGACVAACRFDAISMAGGKAMVDTSFCEGCTVCRRVCPEKAISLVDTRQGTSYEGLTQWGLMWHARLIPGGENSGKLVQFLRESALRTARERDIPLILTDGPPGIACPAISAITGADLAIAVTEPSKAAFHDVERLSQVTSSFGIPTAFVINKADLAPKLAKQLKEEAQARNWNVLGKIPFNKAVVEAIAETRIPVHELHEEIQSIRKRLEDFL
ncbi:MAG: ATP-binding protein [Thermovirgaceae bacterium]